MVNSYVRRFSQFAALLTTCALFTASVFGRWLERNLAEYIYIIPYLGAGFVAAVLAFSATLTYQNSRDSPLQVHWGKLLLSLILTTGLTCLVVFLCESMIVTPIERIHFVKYAVLSFFLFFSQGEQSNQRKLLTAFFLAAAVGGLEECLQHFVPTRVFDLRDILMNLISVGTGVCFVSLLLYLQKHVLLSDR